MRLIRSISSYEVSTDYAYYNVTSKRKFWNPIRWFKRKHKTSDEVVVVEVTELGKDALRSRSTSELSVTEEERRRSSTSMHPGLSLSHDSVFHSPNSGSDMELDAAQRSSSQSISQPPLDIRLQNELTEILRKRTIPGDTSEDDEGLPHSSCNSPTASDGLHIEKTAIKDPTKSHSTCSDGSLHSMGSYEDDEFSEAASSRHSSKLSLNDKKHSQDSNSEFGTNSTATPLNHSAAHHRVSVKPKRTHGAPRRRRTQQLTALPVTPEVNEDSSIRSLSPEIQKKESLIELYSMSSTKTLTETQLKCSSLPPGLTPPGSTDNKLNRSKSNAGSKSQDIFSRLPEDSNEKTEKLSLLERFFPRKSGRKKKKEQKEAVTIIESFTQEKETILEENKKKIENSRPIPAPRSGPATRQRMFPKEIIDSVEESIIPSPDDSIQIELENKLKQKEANKSPTNSPTVISSRSSEMKMKSEEIRCKLKMPGLSALQQRVLSLNDDEPDNNNFLSLTDLPTDNKPSRPVWKSHSFKAVKRQTIESNEIKTSTQTFLNEEKKEECKMIKAASLDDKLHLSESASGDAVTISGPSHTAVVNVTSNVEDFNTVSKNLTAENIDGSTTISIKEQQISITKIQVRRESTQIPEFINKQLNKVEIKPTSNIILSMKSPRAMEESIRPKTLFNFDEVTAKPPTPRKFSKENVEIIEKEETSPIKSRTSDSRKSSDVIFKEKTTFRSKSASLDSLNDTDKSSQDSLDKMENKLKDSPVVLRKKSLQNKKADEEPELMKVFARRSLKIKDGDIETLQESLNDTKTRDSDKENRSDSPIDDRRRTYTKFDSSEKEEEEVNKSPSGDTRTSPIVLRRTLNNNIFLGQRAVTVNPAKTTDLILRKTNFGEHRKTDQWISNIKNDEVEIKEKIDDDIMAGGGFIMEAKNFSQRKAEWEKRAQQAQKKNTP
ncbi:uncharacterized protein LOC130440913 isoform X2 [Diorhabda sublineata]|uniref:uncharacterized protein LOC130440913 isoform X2 n=1 Tax=Diorhabda sublineata TaxID=1163346 RepID=UPI0024E16B9E|nr:uncharacterized protein LOC130440913 isoform X2 [Diorhabda sublineata]